MLEPVVVPESPPPRALPSAAVTHLHLPVVTQRGPTRTNTGSKPPYTGWPAEIRRSRGYCRLCKPQCLAYTPAL